MIASRRYNGWKALLIIFFIALVVLGYLAYRYRGHLFSAFGWITDETGGKTPAVLSIALALGMLVCFVFWMIFPILVYFGLKDLRRRTAELNETAQTCARLLSQVSANNERLTERGEQSQRP